MKALIIGRLSLLTAGLAILLVGCSNTEPTGEVPKAWNFAVGPGYQQPGVAAPPRFRSQVTPVEAGSLADLPWWQVFGDQKLGNLISEALRNNYDLQVATARIEESRALVGVAASQFYPQLGYQGSAERNKVFFPVGKRNPTFDVFTGLLNVAWEIDIWGRIRHSTDAARANFFASEYFRRGVMLTLVSNVAAAYFQLVELDGELAIARDSSNTYNQTLTYFSRRYRGGTDTKLSTSRAEANLDQSQATIAVLERLIAQQENAICVLLGSVPRGIERASLYGQTTYGQTTVRTPPGLTTHLLKRRPDILQAEQNMMGANAQIGVAVANFFPTIGLSALYGGEAKKIYNIVKDSFSVWNIAGNISGPLFQGGRIYETYKAQQAFWDETVAQYQGIVVEAFREVSDALVAQEKLMQQRAALEKQVAALKDAVRLSLDRYNTGLSNYFEVLEAEQLLYPAEDALAQTRRDQLLTVVSLYKALGGGWKLSDNQWIAGH